MDSGTTCCEILEYLASRGHIPHDYDAHYALFLSWGGRLSAKESMVRLGVGSLSHFYLRLILPGGKGTPLPERACNG